MTHPLVSVITPTTPDRLEFNKRIEQIINYQNYPNIEHLFDYSQRKTIGHKRNLLCSKTKGSIILHMDSDDLYAPDWISQSVNALLVSHADIVGLHNSYFYDTRKQQAYEWIPKPHAQTYLLGATLCYWRHVWERKPFPDVSKGEDTQFISNNGKLYAHEYKEGFIATVHGGNTECHKALPLLTKVNVTLPLLSVLNGQ